jgi:hypothetical protein
VPPAALPNAVPVIPTTQPTNKAPAQL